MLPEQKQIFQSMSAEEKLKLSLRLYFSARHLKEVGLRKEHPEWTEAQIQKYLIELFMYART